VILRVISHNRLEENITMTAGPSIDPAHLLNEQLSQANPDLMRELLTTFVNALLGAGRRGGWRQIRKRNESYTLP
jgi:hypothetical protein